MEQKNKKYLLLAAVAVVIAIGLRIYASPTLRMARAEKKTAQKNDTCAIYR